MKIKLLLAAVSLVGLALPLRSAPLNESTFTEVVKDVNVISGADKTTVPATINNLFKSPDIVRTGPDSRAEMTSADQTVIRVGANSVFSFEAAGRNLDLEQGSVLFHPPAGAGGGTIKSGGSAAAVLGTTLIVTATRDGGFKVIMLEGKGTVTLSDGKSVTLKAGQMVFVLPGGTTFSSVLDINLEKLAANSQLIHGFSHANYLAELGDSAQSEIYKNASLDPAMRDAFWKVRRFLMTNKGLSEDEAISLISVAVDFGITQVVDGNLCVHALVRKEIFE